jgi:hypothetical protein
MPEALQQHMTVTSCSRSADTDSPSLFPSPAVTLNNLMGELAMSLSSTLKILFGEICAFEILHVSYQN